MLCTHRRRDGQRMPGKVFSDVYPTLTPIPPPHAFSSPGRSAKLACPLSASPAPFSTTLRLEERQYLTLPSLHVFTHTPPPPPPPPSTLCLASRHEQDAMLCNVNVRHGDEVPPANVEAALAHATELVNLGGAAFRRDLSNPQARRDFKVCSWV